MYNKKLIVQGLVWVVVVWKLVMFESIVLKLLNAMVVKITSYGDVKVKAKANWCDAKWESYFKEGKLHAKWVADYFQKRTSQKK